MHRACGERENDMLIVNGSVFCEDGVFRDLDLAVQGSAIAGMEKGTPSAGQELVDASGCYVVPGMVDIHIHGAMGADFSDGAEESIHTMGKFLLTKGVTSYLGTSMALPEERLTKIFTEARPVIGCGRAGEATLRGINMEGPFFNAEKRGAQNEKYIIPPDAAMFSRLQAASGNQIRTVAVAPETDGGLDFIRAVSPSCSVSLAHTCAGYDTAREALAAGANHITHVFNAMPAFQHREPGVVGAAVDSDAFVELICDGVHIHPAVVRSAFRLFGAHRVCLISDAMRACGMPDGRYDLGGQPVTVANGCATIDSGSLAGSITSLTDCVRNAVRFGIPLESALTAATINPARSVGLEGQIGSLAVGKQADILLLNGDLSLKAVVFAGVLQR